MHEVMKFCMKAQAASNLRNQFSLWSETLHSEYSVYPGDENIGSLFAAQDIQELLISSLFQILGGMLQTLIHLNIFKIRMSGLS